jgi:hypothetical protein
LASGGLLGIADALEDVTEVTVDDGDVDEAVAVVESTGNTVITNRAACW